jgi:hypothetical protein
MKALILLGINCGFGNADWGTLPLSAVNLESGWVDYPRPKTGIARRCSVWPETIEAIKKALVTRPAPKKAEHASLVFLTKYGQPWAKLSTDNTLAKELVPLLRKRIEDAWPGLGGKLELIRPGASLQLGLAECRQVRDLTPLQGMPLTELALAGCPVSDLTPLRGMALTSLTLVQCGQVSDLTPLQGMPLTWLNLDHWGQVRDLTSPHRNHPVRGSRLHRSGGLARRRPRRDAPGH